MSAKDWGDMRTAHYNGWFRFTPSGCYFYWRHLAKRSVAYSLYRVVRYWIRSRIDDALYWRE